MKIKGKLRTMQRELVNVISALIIFISIALLAFSWISCTNVYNNSINSFMSPLAEQAAASIESNMMSTSESLDRIVDATKSITSDNFFLLKTKVRDNIPTDIKEYAVYNNSYKSILSVGSNAVDITDETFLTSAMENQETIVSKPYSVDDVSYISIYKPFKFADGIINVIVCMVPYKTINDFVNNLSFGETGKAYLISDDGLLISQSDTNAESVNYISLSQSDNDYKDIAGVQEKIISGDTGIQKYSFNGTRYLCSGSYVPSLNSYVIVYSTTKALFNVNSLIISGVVVLVIVVCLAIITAIWISKAIQKPIIGLRDRLDELAEGNLTDPVEKSHRTVEFKQLGEAMEQTVISLRTYVTTISDCLNNIANGDLTDRMHGHFKGDFVRIKSTFNTILASLIDTFGNINSAAEQVNSGANQVSNGAQALSQGATEQASAIEQLSERIVDVSDQINSNATAAKTAAGIVNDNTDEVNKCDNDMKNMLTAMDEIGSSSNEISKIIKVIDDIAFQTNILALNAAVEAARAGAAGKGFAVVADEVRSLAAKSAEAANQTTQLIQSSVNTVDKGTKIAKQTAEALLSIVDSSNKINDLVQEIAESSTRQSEAVNQINTGVEQISSVIQTNTATAEESAAASEELSGQSLILKNMVNKFKLGDKDKLFGKNAVHQSGDGPVITNSFAFNDTASSETSSKEAPKDDEFTFGGSLDDNTSGQEDKTADSQQADTSADDEEFAFSGTLTDDGTENINDDDTKY